MISSDQFNVHTAGRKLTGYGREGPENSLHGGTLYTDAASGLIYAECQVSMGAGETVLGKAKFEQWIWNLAGVCAKHYHSDNEVYDAEAFRQDCIGKDQSQTFSGVGAKHLNAIAERNIQTICYWARTMVVHSAIHWPSDGGLSPLEIFTKSKSDHADLLRTHVWGCPVFVLDPRLQDGKKIPKWNRRSRMAQFLGFSPEHSSLVGNVRHLQTNFVSPQYHLVYDDLFQTIFNGGYSATETDSIFDELFENARDVYSPIEHDKDGAIVYEPPPLDNIWLTEEERREKKVDLQKRRDRDRDRWTKEYDEVIPAKDTTPDGPPVGRIPGNMSGGPIVSDDEDSDPEDNSDSDDDFNNPDPVDTVPEGATANPTTAPTNIPTSSQPAPRRSQRSRQERNPLAGLERHPQFGALFRPFPHVNKRTANLQQFACTFGSQQPPSLSDAKRRSHMKKLELRDHLARKREENDQLYFANLDWSPGRNVSSLLTSELAGF
ncbi:hypothetical protein ACHAXR_002811, partial [Thalassiosira sp. AJA248-18]